MAASVSRTGSSLRPLSALRWFHLCLAGGLHTRSRLSFRRRPASQFFRLRPPSLPFSRSFSSGDAAIQSSLNILLNACWRCCSHSSRSSSGGGLSGQSTGVCPSHRGGHGSCRTDGFPQIFPLRPACWQVQSGSRSSHAGSGLGASNFSNSVGSGSSPLWLMAGGGAGGLILEVQRGCRPRSSDDPQRGAPRVVPGPAGPGVPDGQGHAGR